MEEKSKKSTLYGLDGYKLPEEKEVIVDNTDGNSVKEIKDLTPWERIVYASEKHGVKIQNPKPNCSKSGCYGRGYTSIEHKTGIPVPCSCIFPKEQKKGQQAPPPINNYKARRHFKKVIGRKSYLKKMRKIEDLESIKLQEQLKDAGEKLALDIIEKKGKANIQTSGVENE